jgi:hypothetical protein
MRYSCRRLTASPRSLENDRGKAARSTFGISRGPLKFPDPRRAICVVWPQDWVSIWSWASSNAVVRRSTAQRCTSHLKLGCLANVAS